MIKEIIAAKHTGMRIGNSGTVGLGLAVDEEVGVLVGVGVGEAVGVGVGVDEVVTVNWSCVDSWVTAG